MSVSIKLLFLETKLSLLTTINSIILVDFLIKSYNSILLFSDNSLMFIIIVNIK